MSDRVFSTEQSNSTSQSTILHQVDFLRFNTTKKSDEKGRAELGQFFTPALIDVVRKKWTLD